jgi:hypothetical protein
MKNVFYCPQCKKLETNSEFDSAEELYVYFKMLVNGFVSQEVE